MWLIVMKGFAGSGKSTLGRALSKRFGWPLVDKDDIRDLLGDHAPNAGPLAYMIMFNIARRQLQHDLSVICDSPLTGKIAYERACAVATETQASLAVLECRCSDEALWQQRIDGRKALQLPQHHQTDWEAYQAFLRQPAIQEQYPITHPYLIVDTARPLRECLNAASEWLEHLQHAEHE